MDIWRYRAYTKEGIKKSGTLEAGSEHEIKEKLRSLGLILSHLQKETQKSSLSHLTKAFLHLKSRQGAKSTIQSF
jgi:type II secretory pathway component PulF